MSESMSTFRGYLDIPREQLHSCLILRQEEVRKAMQVGVDHAVENLGPQITKWAEEAAKERIKKEVDAYFSYGEGSKAINKMVNEGLQEFFKNYGV